MRGFWLIATMIAVLPSLACAQTDRFNWSPHYDLQSFKALDRKIDPDKSVYGLSFGSPEKDLVAAFGDPTGVVMLNETRKGYLYSKSHFFVFRNGLFRELYIRDNILDWRVSKQMDDHPFFDRALWVFEPGITNDMDFGAVMDVFGRPHESPDYRFTVDGEQSVTELTFTHRTDMSGEKSYNLLGLAMIYYGD